MTNNVPDCYYRISIKALIKNEENKILLIQEDTGLRELPWGGLGFGETAQEGLHRELLEEMWLEALHIAKKPSFFFTRQEKWCRKSNIVYETTLKHLNFTPTQECVAIRFFSPQEMMLQQDSLYHNVQMFANLLQE